MTAWDELTGQDDAIALLRDAAREGSEAMTHSWLITGPPGSGRSNLAYAFAAELLGVSLMSVNNWVRGGKIQQVKVAGQPSAIPLSEIKRVRKILAEDRRLRGRP